MKSSTELLRQMEKDLRGTSYTWLLFVVWLVGARWFGLHNAADDLWEWRLWLLFGGLLLIERWAIKCMNIIVAAIKETAGQTAP
jgi:hypothetical protein